MLHPIEQNKEYKKWILSENCPIKRVQDIHLDDTSHFKYLYSILRKNKKALNFWLINYILPEKIKSSKKFFLLQGIPRAKNHISLCLNEFEKFSLISKVK